MKKVVQLIYRRPRETGNFSIETSFDQMVDAFPIQSNLEVQKFVSSYFSNGIRNRWKAIQEVKKLKGDLFHVTGDTHYLTLGLPADRTILTIHDCGFMRDYKGLKRQIIKRFWLDQPVKHCKRIVAVSEATKQDIIHYTGCKPDKIIVIPTIINQQFKRSDKLFNEVEPRILHIGLAHNKNFERHVQAITGLSCHFHIIGKLNLEQVDLLKRYNIHYTSEYNISNLAMQRAYEESDMLLFASTLEGFGMPIIEAQTVGRAVVTSNYSSMPEIAGQGACLVNPYEVSSIREGILKVIRDGQYRESIVQRGFVNIERFEPEQVANAYMNLYESTEYRTKNMSN